MTTAAHLRVYVPADDAEPAWLALPSAPRRPPETWRLTRFGITTESLAEDVLVAEHDGTRYLCPRMPRLRMLEGVLAFHNAFDELGADLIVPESVALRAAAELESLRMGSVDNRSHILTSQWHVPLRWFLLFEPTDRLLTVDDDGLRLRYRAIRRLATKRLRRAVRALRAAGMDATTEDMEHLLDWLLEFPPNRLVELDYGGVVDLFDPDTVADDDSCELLWSAIECLEEGDFDGARRSYEETASRWADPMLLAFAN